MTERKKRDEDLSKDKEKIERIEQRKLAEELADHWEDYLGTKSSTSIQYRKALDAQVATKKIIDQHVGLFIMKIYFSLAVSGNFFVFPLSTSCIKITFTCLIFDAFLVK